METRRQMMLQSSTTWIVLIALGAALVAISNIQYNRSRDLENKQSKARQAKELLRVELQRNISLVPRMRAAIEKSSMPVTAWNPVSNTDLLLGLPNDELVELLSIYRLVNRANELHTKLIDTMVGIASALHGKSETQKLYFNEVSTLLNELEPLLARTATWVSPNSGEKPNKPMEPLHFAITSRPDYTKKLAASRPAKKVNDTVWGVSVSYGRWLRDGASFDEGGNPDYQDSSDFSSTVEGYLLGEFKLHFATPVPIFYQNQIKNAVERARREP
jgi:hypothetical protein